LCRYSDFHSRSHSSSVNVCREITTYMSWLSSIFKFAPRYFLNSRLAGTTCHYSNAEALGRWTSSPKQLVLSSSFHFEPLSDLYVTLPTRDGSRKPYQPPITSSPLGYGHHLPFFHERIPESQLREDGTEDTFCPPKPFTRRMWAGGRMTLG